MTADLVRITLHVTEDRDVFAVHHWSDNSLTVTWGLGFWSAVCLCWRNMRNGVPVDVE